VKDAEPEKSFAKPSRTLDGRETGTYDPVLPS
jgi:hypothetical protein